MPNARPRYLTKKLTFRLAATDEVRIRKAARADATHTGAWCRAVILDYLKNAHKETSHADVS